MSPRFWGRLTFPPEDWATAIPYILADITRKTIPERRYRTSPRALKRVRHNSYRVKKPGEASSARHLGPATIRIHALEPRAA
jgi:hypothetical protein